MSNGEARQRLFRLVETSTQLRHLVEQFKLDAGNGRGHGRAEDHARAKAAGASA
jgi:hypothetical protein